MSYDKQILSMLQPMFSAPGRVLLSLALITFLSSRFTFCAAGHGVWTVVKTLATLGMASDSVVYFPILSSALSLCCFSDSLLYMTSSNYLSITAGFP